MKDLKELLTKFQEVFAWSYEDMPGIDPEIAQHHIDTHAHMILVKQKLRCIRIEWQLKIKEEITKQLKLWFNKLVHRNKEGWEGKNVRKFRYLNKACPKDDFPLPHIDILVDNTADNVLKSFMDGFLGYNQIKMAPKDMNKTTFIT